MKNASMTEKPPRRYFTRALHLLTIVGGLSGLVVLIYWLLSGEFQKNLGFYTDIGIVTTGIWSVYGVVLAFLSLKNLFTKRFKRGFWLLFAFLIVFCVVYLSFFLAFFPFSGISVGEPSK
jgi:hypothetical protein